MITAISGIVIEISETCIALQVGPIVVSVVVVNAAHYTLKETVTIKTYLHWNQEQGFSLFGFQHEGEKTIFLELLQCSGVGPRLALSIIAHFSVSALITIVQKNDLDAITSISGIGQKKGEQILLYMKHALKRLEHLYSVTEMENGLNRHMIDVEKTLITLQYTKNEAQQAVRHVYQTTYSAELKQEETFDQLLRKALKFLSTVGR